MTAPLLEVETLSKDFRAGGHSVRAVDDVSFMLRQGETLAVVGESGSGKTTLGRCILRLEEPTAGRIVFEGNDLTHLSAKQLRPIRERMQMVFQDPYTSLNPRKRVRQLIGDVLRAHGERDGARVQARIAELLDDVGLRPEHAGRRPHAFSGGQRQRIGIARALALKPKLIVADEPVSALDVSIQAQIINLMADLQDEHGLTYLIIAHDLGLVRQVADRVAVMYLGQIVEQGASDALYRSPMHPYTEALLSAVPLPDPEASAGRRRIALKGDLPSPINPPSGCRFHTRCPHATELCRMAAPPPVAHADGRQVACHFPRNADDDARDRAMAALDGWKPQSTPRSGAAV